MFQEELIQIKIEDNEDDIVPLKIHVKNEKIKKIVEAKKEIQVFKILFYVFKKKYEEDFSEKKIFKK